MKRIVLIIGFALAGQAWAQAQKPAAEPAKPAAAQEAPKPAGEAHAKASRKPNPHNPKRSEDARHCLDLPSNTEIIKCAEEYL
ncbi:MAG TPA: hypothetical protein VF262_07425 [Burkholderiales bacterium]